MTTVEDQLSKSNFKVLVVDDEIAVGSITQSVIDQAGFACQSATSGEEALQIIRAETIHLVITDIRMPGMSGVELAEAVLESNPRIMIVFMTGYTEYETVSRAIKFRPQGYLEKPFMPPQVLDLVEQAYSHRAERVLERQQNEILEKTVTEKTRELEFKTERLVAEKELLQGIISHANFGLVALDPVGFTHLLNPLAKQLLSIENVPADSYHGKALLSLLPEDLSDHVDRLCKSVHEEVNLQCAEFSNQRTERRLNAIGYPLKHRDQVVGIVLIIHDITETVNLQKRLLQSAKLASIGELAAGVAHEINNPLGFVISNISTLAKYREAMDGYIKGLERMIQSGQPANAQPLKQLAAFQKKFDIEYVLEDFFVLLTETQDGLDRVAKIVSDLKTFAHPDSDAQSTCDINALIDDALNLVRNETKYHLEIRRDFADLPMVPGLPSQLVQVFTNMFVNAAQAANERGILEIVTRANESNVIIRVRDDGKGIPEKHLQTIFDPFFTTKPAGQGTGMGLSITYGIIKRHGGAISVSSVEGEGTEFVIELPLSSSQETATADKEHVPSISGG